ncbi:MAG: hypothetical protein E6Q92_02950 [Burkholderiaceae bacterium]|nr:MAG: hypothetical protein E6Q92_02950 [Burkholderiaceae bacterium]
MNELMRELTLLSGEITKQLAQQQLQIEQQQQQIEQTKLAIATIAYSGAVDRALLARHIDAADPEKSEQLVRRLLGI